MAREANVVVRDPGFAARLRSELLAMIDEGARRVAPQQWAQRPPIIKVWCWIAYGFVRVAMGFLGYGGNEWWKGTRPASG